MRIGIWVRTRAPKTRSGDGTKNKTKKIETLTIKTARSERAPRALTVSFLTRLKGRKPAA